MRSAPRLVTATSQSEVRPVRREMDQDHGVRAALRSGCPAVRRPLTPRGRDCIGRPELRQSARMKITGDTARCRGVSQTVGGEWRMVGTRLPTRRPTKNGRRLATSQQASPLRIGVRGCRHRDIAAPASMAPGTNSARVGREGAPSATGSYLERRQRHSVAGACTAAAAKARVHTHADGTLLVMCYLAPPMPPPPPPPTKLPLPTQPPPQPPPPPPQASRKSLKKPCGSASRTAPR